MALEPAKLADFKLAGALGSGTTAKVYEAVHSPSGRPVAIKIMEGSGPAGELRERFAREALLLSGVDSRHVGRILGYGFDKGQPFLVLERLHGETLDAKLRRDGPVPPAIAVQWIEQLIIGVRDCHDAKVIHRDIKPSNIFLHRDANGMQETAKLIDFGVARLRELADASGALTSQNHLIGSMGYMAPEQFRSAKTVGFQADLYAVGVVVFRTITGRLPFVSRSIDALIKMKTEQTAPTISSMPGMPMNASLDWFVLKATARDLHERFQSAREMLEQWRNVMSSLEGRPAVTGRVDESYAGPVPRQPVAAYDEIPEDENTIKRAPPALVTPFATTGAPSTLGPGAGNRPRPPSSPPASTTAISTIPGFGQLPAEGAPRPAVDEAPTTQPFEHPMNESTRSYPGPEAALRGFAPPPEAPVPPTVASPGGPPPPPRQDGDPFEIPTQLNKDLRKLVERELELQRTRKPRE